MCRLFIIFAVFLMVAMPAHANLRAPITVDKSPSTALYKSGMMDLVVAGESLNFSCTSNQCDVEATYTFRTRRAQNVLLSFILPGPATVTVVVNKTKKPQSISSTEAKDPFDKIGKSYQWHHFSPSNIHEAKWRASLVNGINTVTVRYKQELALEERNHSYEKSGEMIRIVAYEVWPIKEWSRSDEFAMEFSIVSSVTQDADSLVCYGATMQGDRQDSSFLPPSRVEGGLAKISFQFKKEPLPDRLHCEMGKKENLTRIRQ